jgi:hypothetical protein
MPITGGPPPPPPSREPVAEGDYGVVMITAGPHAGKLGYYDDDCPEGCIVYVDGPAFFGPIESVPREALGKATDAEARWWEATMDNERAQALAAERIRSQAHSKRRRARAIREELKVPTPAMLRAEIRLTIRDKKRRRETWMKTECELAIVPAKGMTLAIGDPRGDCEFVDVDEVQYYVHDRKLVVDVSYAERMLVEPDDGIGPMVWKEQHEFVPDLERAGFRVQHVFDEPPPKRKRRRAAGMPKARQVRRSASSRR